MNARLIKRGSRFELIYNNRSGMRTIAFTDVEKLDAAKQAAMSDGCTDDLSDITQEQTNHA